MEPVAAIVCVLALLACVVWVERDSRQAAADLDKQMWAAKCERDSY